MKYYWTFATGILLLLCLLLLAGCRYTTNQVDVSVSNAWDSDNGIRRLQPLRMSHDWLDTTYRNIAVKPLHAFYERRKGALFWISGVDRLARADSLIAFIEKIRYFGLLPGDYHAMEIHMLKDSLNSVENIYRFEALLTNAYITISRHIAFGKRMGSTGVTDSLAILSLERYSELGGLDGNIAAGEPSFSGYRSLKQGLGQLLDSLSPEQRNAVLVNAPTVPDEIMRRIETTETNLERWRTEPRPFGSRYIFVNIPAFMLYLVENDSVVLESRVIVGTPERPTPELSSTIDCFITYPYWHVPRRIAVEEYLPLIQKDTSFLSRNNFDVLDRRGNLVQTASLDWKSFSASHFPFSLRQREGEENALGVIKFVFDNPYAVFLHDTNARRLFKSKVRAFSHGCIRMENAAELAHYLVMGHTEKRSKYVERFLIEKSRHWIELQKPIPVFVRYYTSEFRNGRLRYYFDIYQKDEPVHGRVDMAVDKTDVEIELFITPPAKGQNVN